MHISHNQYMEYIKIFGSFSWIVKDLVEEVLILSKNTIDDKLNIGWWLSSCLLFFLISIVFISPIYSGIWGIIKGIWNIQFTDIFGHLFKLYRCGAGMYGLVIMNLWCMLLNSMVPRDDYFEFNINGEVFNWREEELGGGNLIHQDDQNVHDTVIQKYLVKAVEDLKRREKDSQTPPISDEESLAQLWKSCFLNQNTRLMAFIRDIENSNTYIMNIKCYEKEILALVWRRIQHPINLPRRADLVENLHKQMLDAIGVCCQGRITRILQSLEGGDMEEIVQLKPTWITAKRVDELVAWYRNRISHLLKTSVRQSYEIGENEQQSLRINRMIEKHVRQHLIKELVKTGIMTEARLEPLITNSIKWL